MKLEEHVSLKTFNTFGIDVHAAQFATVTSVEELQSCLKQATFAPFVLGGGSNILFLDDVNRTVLHNAISGVKITKEESDGVVIQVGAGVIWHDLVTWAVDNDLGGLENLALIPGTVGAAPIQNIGAYGVEIQEHFESLLACRLADGSIRSFEGKECVFGYRDSIFKGEAKGQYCILEVSLRLSKPPHPLSTGYGAIQHTLEAKSIQHPTVRDVYEAVIDIRRAKLPDPAVIGNAGSFFKNPVVDVSVYQKLQSEYERMPGYPVENNGYKIPAGWLIEQCGWKGKRVGNVGCYEKQSLVIVNYGGASGQEVYDHAQHVAESVKNRFGINLVREVNVFSAEN